MRRNRTIAALTTLSVLGLVLTADAQEKEINSVRRLPICQSNGNASRVREACEHAPVTITQTENETELTLPVVTPEGPAQCEASVSTEYVQSPAFADVEGVIEVEGCAAASGEYTILARIRDERGEIRRLEFDETWRRDDDQSVTFSTRYPIGRNVELLNVRARGVRCLCAEESTD